MSEEDIVGVKRRVAFLREEMGRESFNMPENVILFVATSIEPQERALRGALIRLKAFQSMTPGRTLTIEDVRDICKDSISSKRGKPSR